MAARSPPLRSVGSASCRLGNIKAKNIVVGGRVKGSLDVAGKVTLESSSQLNGDLSASRLIIEEGAQFNGSSTMNKDSALPKPKPQITLDTLPNDK